VQAALERYRDTKSEAEARAIEERFAGSVLRFDRKNGALGPREEPLLTKSDLVAALGLAASYAPASLEAAIVAATGDLVWHSAIGAPTASDERALSLLTTARSFSEAFADELRSDGGTPPVGTITVATMRDAGAPPDASPPDAGRSDPPIDWCLYTCPPQPSLEEKLLCKGLKLLARQAARHSEETGEQLEICPPNGCGIGREGFRGRLRVRDLLQGELSGRATYGFECGGGIMEVSVFGSGIGGSDPDYGIGVSWGIRF
jgi:hypothetical protein